MGKRPATEAKVRRKGVGNGQGSVYQEGVRTGQPGRWVAQVKAVDGKFRRTYHPTKGSAIRALRTMLGEVDKGTPIGDGNTTVADLLDRWEQKVLPAQPLSPRTLDTYAWACSVLRDDLGTVRLRRLTPDTIEAAFEDRARQTVVGDTTRPGMSRASLVKVRSVLGKALDYALRRGYVAQNAARIVELPADARRTAPGRSLTPLEAGKLIETSATFIRPTSKHPDPRPHPLHALWVVMLYLGLRPGEATGLLWTDIDLDAGLIHVRRSLKLERGELAVSERLKTDKVGQAPSRAHRTLEALPRVIDALRAHRARQNRARLEAGELWEQPIRDLMFTTQLGGPLHPRNVHRALKAITERAGLGAWHPHELRHSCASLLSAAGVPVERIADQLGHDGTRMGLLVYRHATKPSVDAGLAMADVIR